MFIDPTIFYFSFLVVIFREGSGNDVFIDLAVTYGVAFDFTINLSNNYIELVV